MTEIPQAALDAGAAALAEDGCRTGATHGIDARTVLEAAAPHSGQAPTPPTPPKPAGTPLPEKLERFSSGEETLAKIRELHSDIWLGHDGTPICEACDHKAPCETLRIIEQGDNQ